MIRWTVLVSALAFAAVIAGGCSKPAKPGQGQPARKPSVANTVAEEITGYRAVKQGEQLKAKIRAIDKQHDEDIDAILGDK